MKPRYEGQRKNDVCYSLVMLAALAVLVGSVVMHLLDPRDGGQLARVAPSEQRS
jgi:hypothetical protein